MAQSQKTSQDWAPLSSNVRLPSMKALQPIRYEPPAWQWRCKQSPMPSAGLPQEAIVTDSISLLQKVSSGMGSSGWNVSMVDIHCRKLLWVYCPGHAGEKRNDQADRLAGKSNPHKWLASRKRLRSTKPRTSHYRSPGRKRNVKRKR